MTDGQREEQARVMAGNDPKTVTTMPGDNSVLVAAWMQRLQVLTLITTFLASIDGELFVLTSSSQGTLHSRELVYACFTGALMSRCSDPGICGMFCSNPISD